MTQITFKTIGNMQDTVTAASNINYNFTQTQAALGASLAKDGTDSKMAGNLDMNSNQILNLPYPATQDSPIRLRDMSAFIPGGQIGTVTSVSVVTANGVSGTVANPTTTPAITLTLSPINLAGTGSGGVTGNLPVTNLNSGTGASGTTFWRGDGTWASVGTSSVGSGVVGEVPIYNTTSTIAGTNALNLASGGTLQHGVSGSIVGASTYFNNTAGGAITITPPATGALGSSVLTLPIATDTLVGKTTTDTFTNKTISSSNNTISIGLSGAGAATLSGLLPVASGGTNYGGGNWTTTNPTPTSTTGSITATSIINYLTIGRITFLNGSVNVSATSSGGGSIQVALPITPAGNGVLAGAIGGSNMALAAIYTSGTSSVFLTKYDGTTAIGTPPTNYYFSGVIYGP